MLKSYGSDDNIHTLSCMSVCSGDKTGDCHGGKREERFDTCGGINGERERERETNADQFLNLTVLGVVVCGERS